MDFKNGIRDQLISKYRPWVVRIADSILKHLPPSAVERQEVIQWGMIGLVDALKKWDPERENKFKTYAEFRIKGSIRDGLRSIDWVPRSIRDKIKSLDELKRQGDAKFGKSKISVEEPMLLGFIDGDFRDSSIVDPVEVLNRKIIKDTLTREISRLSKKEQFVLALYYYEDMSLREIAKILRVTESRVSQVKKQVIDKLHDRLRGRIDLEFEG